MAEGRVTSVVPRESASALTPAERRVCEAVDAGALLDLLADMIAIESVANEETPAQERVAEEMHDLGLEVDAWPIDFDELKRHPAYTSDVDRHEGLGVVGTYRGSSPAPQSGTAGSPPGRTLILNGHVDVVPAGDLTRWTRPPFRLTQEGDRLFGRGVVDMKGAVCSALAAVRALRDAEVQLAGALQIQSVIAEEDGGAGTLATIERGHTGDGAIVLEPTRFVLAPAQAGALSFQITVPGQAAHGAFREEGVDPVEKFIPIFEALRGLEATRNTNVADPLFAADALPYALTMGRLQAGIWPSTVAESLLVEGRYGIAPGESEVSARAALEAAVEEACSSDTWLSEHPATVEWDGAQFAAARTEETNPIVTTIEATAPVILGSELTLGGMRFGADMRLLVNQGGIPTVLFGPGEVREAHAPDESVLLSDLVLTAKVAAVTAMRFCGTHAG